MSGSPVGEGMVLWLRYYTGLAVVKARRISGTNVYELLLHDASVWSIDPPAPAKLIKPAKVAHS